MANYKVFLTAAFEKKLAKMDGTFKGWFEKMLEQLAENPFTGKPLGVDWFREKKHGKHRVYYLVYENVKSMYVVNLSEKKDQEVIINSIKLLFDMYKKELDEFLGGTN